MYEHKIVSEEWDGSRKDGPYSDEEKDGLKSRGNYETYIEAFFIHFTYSRP